MHSFLVCGDKIGFVGIQGEIVVFRVINQSVFEWDTCAIKRFP